MPPPSVLLRAQTHFAPTYETLLDVYDLERRQGFPLFPPTPPSPFRRRLIDAAAETYADAGEAWCNVNNHHCDASMLDCVLGGDVIYEARADALALSVSYSLSPLDRAATDRRRVVYVYRGFHSGGIEYREVLLPPDAEAGETDVEAYLTRERLDVLFGSPAKSHTDDATSAPPSDPTPRNMYWPSGVRTKSRAPKARPSLSINRRTFVSSHSGR